MLPVAILAGGLATRLHPITEKIPKALLEIKGEPFISRQLRLLRNAGIEKVVLCIGHLGEQVEEVVGDGGKWSMEVRYSRDGETPLGTGGAIKNALPMLGDAFFVLYGDSYLEIEYAEVEKYFLASGREGLMTVFRNEGKWEPGNVRYRNGEILEYDKKKRSGEMKYIDYGLSAFRASAFESLPKAFDLEIVLRQLIGQGQLAGYETSNRFFEIGSRAGIADLEAHLTAQPGF